MVQASLSTGNVSTGGSLDGQLFASLLPSVVRLFELASSDASKQLEIARLASTLRANLESAKRQARDMQGAELTLQDQSEIIAILENEVQKRGL